MWHIAGKGGMRATAAEPKEIKRSLDQADWQDTVREETPKKGEHGLWLMDAESLLELIKVNR